MLVFATIAQSDPAKTTDAQSTPLTGVISPKARATISEVANHRFLNGNPGGVGYKITYDILAEILPEELFPSARVDAAQYVEAFDGQWADDGFHAAWLSPLGKFQYYPYSSTIESAYFDNYIQSDGSPVQGGDSVEIAVKQLAGDTPLTWSRQRSVADGEIGWEVATRSHTVQARYGDASGTMDVVFVRADVVARGGDFDARDGERLPLLVIDLPKSYGPEVTGSAAASQFAPYLHYISNIEGAVLPQAGKAVIAARTRGYIPEAKEYTLPNGAHIREWHIPLHIVIVITPLNNPVTSTAMAALKSGGVVWTFDNDATKRFDVAPGGAVVVGGGLEPKLLEPAQARDASAGAPVTAPGATQLDEVMATAAIDHTLAQPAPILVAKRTYSLTIDPNLDGQGFLGLRSFDHSPTGQSFFGRTAIPFVKVNGETIALDRSRLVELRVLPLANYITIGFTSRSDGDELSYLRARFGHIKRAGLKLDAVYDLGDDRYAFLSAFGSAEAPQTYGNAVDMSLQVWSLSGDTAEVEAVQYGELAQPGPITYGEDPVTYEFSGPTTKGLYTSGTQIFGGATSGGQFTVVRGGAPLTADPIANSSIPFGSGPVGFYLTPRSLPTTSFYESILFSWLPDTAHTQAVFVGPIDQSCATPQVVDDATADASGELDVERAWFEFDGANLYTTIQVARLDPGAGTGAATFRAGWRFEHVGFGVQAQRNDTGSWTYEMGLHSSAGAPWHSIPSVPTVGELKFGTPGFIRMAHPIDVQFASTGFLPGEMLRDTGVTSSNALGVADRAPAGSPDLAFGRGGDYVIALCRSQVELLGAASRKLHGDVGPFNLNLAVAGAPTIESRDGGAAGEHTLVFSFANPLTSVASASVSSGTGTVSNSGIDSTDPRKYVVNLTGVANAQVLTVDLTNVTDAAGNNSAAVSARMGVLLGDTSANGAVNSSDISQTKSQSGQAVTAANFRQDVTVNGSINSSDISLVKSKSGTALPSP